MKKINGLILGDLNTSVMQQALHTQNVTKLTHTKKKKIKLTSQVLQSKHSKATVSQTKPAVKLA